MKFHESGLPKDKLIEAAFDYSHAFTLKSRKAALRDFTQQIDEIHAGQMKTLDETRISANMPESEYKRQKEALEKLRDENMKLGPALVDQALEAVFVARRVNPALEILNHSETKETEVIAATLLCECIRSPRDFQTITEKFGERVANIAAEIAHIDAYPDEREQNMAVASVDAKRVYLAWLSASENGIADQIKQAAIARPQDKLVLPPGHEKQIYTDAAQLWGVDKKLDARLVDAFNKVAEATGSAFRMEVDEKGELGLVKGSATSAVKDDGKPKGPKGPNGGIGGDVF